MGDLGKGNKQWGNWEGNKQMEVIVVGNKHIRK